MIQGNRIPREGDLFLVVTIEDHRFELKYGYYEESDRLTGEPVPIYPDLIRNPLYTKEGLPLVTAVQSPCIYYLAKHGYEEEENCSCCKFYPNIRDEISICQCEQRKKR